jgi:inositol-1,4,5-trisphosphate 5-phosphatase
MVSVDEDGTHEGIKTIRIQKACEFVTNSVLCVCIITWNMNGKVNHILGCVLLDGGRSIFFGLIFCSFTQMSVQDVRKLVSSDRKFDLLVLGLQEAPKSGVAQVLQEAMADTHM